MTNYDPFEDTGDWPFRESAPRPEPARERSAHDPSAAALGDTALDTPSFAEAPGSVPDEVAAEAVVLPPPAEDPAPAEPVSPPAPAAAVVPEQGAEETERPAGDEAVAETPQQAQEEQREHAPGGFVVPPGPEVLAGGPHGFRRSVAVVVSRFNGDITSRMLETALTELRDCNVADEAITVVPVPGAFELPLAALALAKTRRFSCIVALGCVIRGETAHFDLVAGETASGLQLAAIETGIPVSFGVLACQTRAQAEARIERAAEAARTALEMADLFSEVRTRAAG